MYQDDRFSRTVVLIVEVYLARIFFSYIYEGHLLSVSLILASGGRSRSYIGLSEVKLDLLGSTDVDIAHQKKRSS